MKKLLFLATVAVVLSSCSKDATEVAPAPANGKVVMTASMGIGEATRTFLNEDGKYEWSNGDMAGVVAAGVEKPIMLHTPNGGTQAEFIDPANQIAYVGTKDLLFFYPYQAEVSTNATAGVITDIKMTIPATQIYREGSFSTMTAPAIAAVKEFDATAGAANNVKFMPVASYVKVPIRGIGTLEKLTMSIKKDNKYYILNGTNTVTVEDEALEFDQSQIDANADATDKVTIDFGKGAKGLTLYEGKTVNVMFVIPAHLNVVGATFEFEATITDAPTTSKTSFAGPSANAAPAVVAAYSEVQANGIISGKEIILGADDYYVVEDCRDFVTWAHQVYTSQPPKPAYIVADLDFAAYAAGGADAEKVTSCTAEEWNAVQWYRTNDYAIYTPVGNADFTYEIYSDVDGEGGAATISDLKVIGTSVFGMTGHVENLIIKDVELNATDNKNVYFIAPYVESVVTPNALNAVIKNVTIDGGTIIGSDVNKAYVTNAIHAVLVNTENGVYVPAIKDNKYPTFNNNEINYAPNFLVNATTNITRFIDNGVVKFDDNAIYAKVDGYILNVNENSVSNVGVIFDKCKFNTNEVFSVVIGETSYWNGLSYNNNNIDNKFTAEELAYAVANRTDVQLMGLDIDLMGTSTYVKGDKTLYAQNWEKVCNQDADGNIKVDGYYDEKVGSVAVDSRARVISNINIETELIKQGNVYVAVEYNSNNNYSLFGQSAYLKQVKVKDLSISLTKNINLARVAGLAYTGTATDVEIDGLKVRTEIENIGQSAIGAIIAALPSENSNTLKNCVVKNANMLSFKKDGETAYSALARGLFGYLTINQSQTHEFVGCSFDVNSPAKQIVGQAKVIVPSSQSSQVNPILKFKNCSANSLIKKLTWLDSSNQTVTTGNYPVQVWKNGVESYVNIGTTTIK